MSDDFEKMFGREVGRGSQATVYAQGEYAVKLYRESYPKSNVFSEAYIMANLEREDFPAPRIYEVLLVNGRYGLRMDRVVGTLMSEGLREPEKCKETLDALVDLQCVVQKHDKLSWAPDLKQRLHDDLMRNDRISAESREKYLKALDRLPNGRALCHCDFHSSNVFFDGSKYTIIDLLQVSRGDPAADAACSYVAYAFTDMRLADYYLNRYCEQSGISRKRAQQWLPVYAATLLGQVPERLTPIVEKFMVFEEER